MSQAELLSPTHLSPSVSLHSGRPATTSLDVAKFFGKRHDHVLRDVDTLLSQLPENSLQPNFGETYQEQKTPLGVKKVRMFILYRDGFILLVMGYTGKKALAMKLAYIEAFNRMEAELAEQHAALSASAPTPDTQPELSTTEDRKPLRALVGTWSQVSGLPFSACWNQLKAAFNLTDIRDLPREWIPDAIDWVQKRIDALPASAQVAAIAAAPSAVANDAEGHLAAIREHIGHIHRHEEALFKLARKALPPVRKPYDMFSPARRMGMSAFHAMEACDYTLDYSLKALEASIRILFPVERM